MFHCFNIEKSCQFSGKRKIDFPLLLAHLRGNRSVASEQFNRICIFIRLGTDLHHSHFACPAAVGVSQRYDTGYRQVPSVPATPTIHGLAILSNGNKMYLVQAPGWDGKSEISFPGGRGDILKCFIQRCESASVSTGVSKQAPARLRNHTRTVECSARLVVTTFVSTASSHEVLNVPFSSCALGWHKYLSPLDSLLNKKSNPIVPLCIVCRKKS